MRGLIFLVWGAWGPLDLGKTSWIAPLDFILFSSCFLGDTFNLVYRRLGGETNREIDFGFGSVVRARGLVVRWE